jgi:tetratricopeptide (TPR) repeat protein
VNLGFLHRNAGEWSESRSYFESAFAKEDSKGFDGVAFYLLESWMRQSLADSGLTNLDQVNAYLQNQMIGLSTYQHEFKLVELWISVTRSRWETKEEDLAKALLELDPAILIERVVNPYIYRLQPGGLSYLCNDLDQKLKRTKYKEAVVGLCAITDKEYEKAAQVLSVAPQNEYVITLRSFVAELQEKPEVANEYLSEAMEMRADENPTKFFFQARFCFRKGDMKCSAEYWMKALERKPESYTALTGLGQSYFQVEDYEKAKSFAERSAKFVESYGPLIDLQTRLKKVN